MEKLENLVKANQFLLILLTTAFLFIFSGPRAYAGYDFQGLGNQDIRPDASNLNPWRMPAEQEEETLNDDNAPEPDTVFERNNEIDVTQEALGDGQSIELGNPVDWFKENVLLSFWLSVAQGPLPASAKHFALEQISDLFTSGTMSVSAAKKVTGFIIYSPKGYLDEYAEDVAKIFLKISLDSRIAAGAENRQLIYLLNLSLPEGVTAAFVPEHARFVAITGIANVVGDLRVDPEIKELLAEIFLLELKETIIPNFQSPPMDKGTRERYGSMVWNGLLANSPVKMDLVNFLEGRLRESREDINYQTSFSYNTKEGGIASVLGHIYLDERVNESTRQEIAKYVEVIEDSGRANNYDPKVRITGMYIFKLKY